MQTRQDTSESMKFQIKFHNIVGNIMKFYRIKVSTAGPFSSLLIAPGGLMMPYEYWSPSSHSRAGSPSISKISVAMFILGAI